MLDCPNDTGTKRLALELGEKVARERCYADAWYYNLALAPSKASFTPNSSTAISAAPSGRFLSSALNITPRPFAPRPTVRNEPMSGTGGVYRRESVLCHRSW
jgi:hypothetical protein